MPVAGADRFFDGNDEDDNIDGQSQEDVIVFAETHSGEVGGESGISRAVAVELPVELCDTVAKHDVVEHGVYGILECREGGDGLEIFCAVLGEGDVGVELVTVEKELRVIVVCFPVVNEALP